MILGLLLSLIAAILFTVGNLIEKVAVSNMPAFAARRVGNMLRALATSPLWLSGFVISIIGLAVQVVAFSRAPILVVQAAFGGGIVFLVIVARVALHELLHRQEIVGLALAVPALVLVSVSLSGSSSSVGVKNSAWLVVLVAVATLAFVGAAHAFLHKKLGASGFLYGLSSGVAYGVASLGTKGASTFVVRHGVIGAVPDILGSVYPYLFVVASALGLLIFQAGLQRCRIAVVGPVSSVASSIYVVVLGSLLFSEKLPSQTHVLVLRIVGFAGVIAGSYLLARSDPGVNSVEALLHTHHVEATSTPSSPSDDGPS